ncbi:uncharacterized protein HMPREF1120_05817 [Exophiala dermatitidis NIH/UT8656]|uniref:Uncharacterized protein n=1 Tax=Exophiala dermatitidis (strain ATCC 34100 / CBS 525.76 / NIH/UT8656) TaxID=858893 RepID=H6C1R4_EXODN|nr:uncharacterized protein HMPREF1120_05817 [Exophiala dermatitidis NIH/UT8656]EHY57793.1 hypothetical protein HMPREF1120_05817 [Exophiala dermatitidis NIH/UT8656]
MGLKERYRFPLYIRFLIITSFFLAHISPAKSLFNADLKWPVIRPSHNELQPSLTDLLTYREPDQDAVLEKAMHVIETLATQSTCHQGAAAQLLITCNTVGKEEQGKHELLERAKSVYAVRVAVCETREGRAAVPTACKPVLDMPERSGREIDVVNGKLLSSCLEALIGEHYYWTSYSNSRQDANTLCQARSLEATRLEALQSCQKLAELIPDFREALMSTQSRWRDFMKQQEENALKVNKLQQTNTAELKEFHKMELGALRRVMSVAKEGFEDISRGFQQSIVKTGSDVEETREALGHVMTDFMALRNLLADAIQATTKNNAEVAAAQASDLHTVHELALATTETLKELQANEAVQHVNALFQSVTLQLDKVVAAQALQLKGAETHLKLSNKLSEAQKATLSLEEQMRDSSAILASELDSATLVAGRVSSKLDKVNQALNQVEKASSVLSTLSTFLSIPSHFAEHLHLRLFLLLATPSTLLYFWKPRKYSYSLMAVYVFLEAIISLVAEYHDKITSTVGEAGSLFTALCATGLNFVGRHMFAMVFIVAALGCFLAFTSSTDPTPKPSLKRESILLDKDLMPTEKYYMQYRLRNGRLPRSELDRFRRAATVC